MGAFGRWLEYFKTACGRQKIMLRVLGINACLKGMAFNLQLILRAGQWFAAGNSQLSFHQILTTDHLSHRVLDLQTSIHLHKEKLALAIE